MKWIGGGNFASVYKAKWRKVTVVAVKQLRNVNPADENALALMAEVETLRLVKFYSFLEIY